MRRCRDAVLALQRRRKRRLQPIAIRQAVASAAAPAQILRVCGQAEQRRGNRGGGGTARGPALFRGVTARTRTGAASGASTLDKYPRTGAPRLVVLYYVLYRALFRPQTNRKFEWQQPYFAFSRRQALFRPLSPDHHRARHVGAAAAGGGREIRTNPDSSTAKSGFVRIRPRSATASSAQPCGTRTRAAAT